MHAVSLVINDPTEFDKAVKEYAPAVGDVEFISKNNATNSGAPAVLVVMEIQNEDGTTQKFRAVAQVRNLRNALSALISAHGGEM